MWLTCTCPKCDETHRTRISAEEPAVTCASCGYARTLSADDIADGRPQHCLSCGNLDLWRQKDFPQWLGLLMVALGAILSSIAWAYHRPILAMSILAGFAVLDMAFYLLMPDVLVCYRCGARHHVGEAGDRFSTYDHEIGERYRQERLRMEAAGHVPDSKAAV